MRTTTQAMAAARLFDARRVLSAEAPAVYRELALLYQVNPLVW